MPKTLDLDTLLPPDSLATSIAELYVRWESLREGWRSERVEVRNYVFATDTTTTSNKTLPWKNSTTRPKLCQIFDNLVTNYMDALFPGEDWLTWEGNDEDSDSAEKRKVIEDYMRVKTRHARFRTVVEQLITDWVLDGNVFSTAMYVDESEPPTADNPKGRPGYKGPVAVRLDPTDFVFDPAAASFAKSPKISRTLMTLGDLATMVEENPEKQYLQEALDKALDVRHRVRASHATNQLTFGSGRGDESKDQAFRNDGFGSYREYLETDYVEVLDFYGSVFDVGNGTLHKDAAITVIDRAFVVRNQPIPHFLRGDVIVHAPWRARPGNLYGMGPLDNLVGMQYRIDHLENLKADVFDMIAQPTLKISGTTVQDFEYGPSEMIYLGDEGDVTPLAPPTEALTADLQIERLELEMEVSAGAPREAAGFRTPGEKTKFEFQRLESAASRMYVYKLKMFETRVLQPLLNLMLDVTRRNMDGTDTVRIVDEFGNATFPRISGEDLAADGILHPLGASRAAAKANMLQNLLGLAGSALGQDPEVKMHWPGKNLARVGAELVGGEEFGMFKENGRLNERAELQRLAQVQEENLEVEAATPAGVTEDDVG